MKIIFMGTPEFAVPALEALIAAGHDIACVYTQPPRPAGRGQQVRRSPVHEAALRHGIDVLTPARVRRDEEAHARFAAFGADAAVVAAYGLILPQAMLDAPRLGCLNIHASLLPRWRGASPIQSAILAGDTRSGVSIMQMDAGLDTGAVLAEAATPIASHDTASTLHDRLAALGAALVVDTLARPFVPVAQPEAGVTYAERLTRESGRIDWGRPAVEIDRLIRGLTPWPGAFTTLSGEILKIGGATLAPGPAPGRDGARPGAVLDDRLTVACGEGALRLTRVQRPGRAMMDADAFLRGQKLDEGVLLGGS